MIENILKQFGLTEKEIKIYLTLLPLGPSSVRKVAEESGINRGTTYDILKSLINQGLASYYHKDKKQYFSAEDPESLVQAVKNKQNSLRRLEEKVTAAIPELKSLAKSGQKPVVKFYQGARGIRNILQDVLDTMAKEKAKEYCVYSSAEIREHLYQEFPDFTTQRIKSGIKVKAIAFGQGGKEEGLDERRWLNKEKSSPSYILIYSNKVAMISVDSSQQLLGVVIEDKNLAATQKMIHQFVWGQLK